MSYTSLIALPARLMLLPVHTVLPPIFHRRLCAAAVTLALLSGCAAVSPVVTTAKASPAEVPATSVVAQTNQTDDDETVQPEPEATDKAGKTETAAVDEAEAAEQQLLPKLDMDSRLLYSLLVSDIAAQRGQPQLAMTTYLDLAKKTRDPRLARRALEHAITSGQINFAIDSATLWLEIDPKSSTALHTLVSMLVRTNRLSEAEPHLAKLIAARPAEAGNSLLQLRSLWNKQSDKQAVLVLTQALAKPYADLPEAALALGFAEQAAGHADKALVQVDLALGRRPGWDIAILLKAHLLEGRSEKEALEFLAEQSVRYPQAKEVRMSYARNLIDARRLADARKVYDVLNRDFPDTLEIVVGLGMTAMQGRDYRQAESAFVHALDLKPRNPAAIRYYLGVTAEEQRNFDRAMDWYRSVPDGDYRDDADRRLVHIYSRQGQKEPALALAEKMPVDTESNKIMKAQTLAQIHRENKDLTAARKVLDTALKEFPNSTDLLYDRSLISEQLGQLDVAERDLRRYLEIKPNSATALNALGYTLAARTSRLDEAEHLIGQALAIEPDNPVIIDSSGWLQYRRGNFQEAARQLKRAFELLPDPEIAAHLGEVLWQLNQRDEALKVWDQGKQLDPKHDVLADTIKRLTGK